MTRNSNILILVLVVLVAVVFFIFGFLSSKKSTPTLPIPSATPLPSSSLSPSPVSSENITVVSPKPNEKVSSPILLKGEARVFENVLNYRLLDSSGNVLKSGNIQANAPDVGQFGSFSEDISYSTNDSSGTLEVFSLSPKDGSEINKVTIPLKF